MTARDAEYLALTLIGVVGWVGLCVMAWWRMK